MSVDIPRKRKRLSKNKKRNWRKTDIADVEEHLEDVRMQQRTGGLASEKLDEQLFFVDKVAEEEVQVKRKRKREPKPLKCHALLEPDPNIRPAKISHNIPKEINILRRKSIRVLNSDGQITKTEAKDANLQRSHNEKAKIDRRRERREKNIAKYDLWNDATETVKEDDFYMKYTRQAKVKPPKNLREKPSEVPAIEKPHPGQSFNPTYIDHQDLLRSAHNVEVEKLKEQMKIKRALDDKFPTLTEAPTEKTWIAEMSGGLREDSDNDSDTQVEFTEEELSRISNNPPVRRENKKTEKQRRKEREAKEKIKEMKKQKLAKVKENELTSHLKYVKKEINRTEMQLKQRLMAKKMKKLGEKDKPKKLGKIKYTEPNMAVKLSDELVGSLRQLKPEGDLLHDRYKSLQKRNMLEPRQRAKNKKRKVKYAEKKTHKEVTL